MTRQENNLLIHLIGPKDKSKWPLIWNKCYNIWKTSPYKIKLWNDEEDIDNLLKEEDPDFFQKLNSLPKIFKLDYVRYLILEKFGGAYFDLDVEVKLDFLPSLSTQKIYIVEANKGVTDEIVQNCIMISLDKTPLSKFFWNTVKNYSKTKVKNNFKICKDQFYKLPEGTNIRETVGSIMLSEVYNSPPFFTSSYIQLLSHLHFNHSPHDFKICIHHQTGKWNL